MGRKIGTPTSYPYDRREATHRAPKISRAIIRTQIQSLQETGLYFKKKVTNSDSYLLC